MRAKTVSITRSHSTSKPALILGGALLIAGLFAAAPAHAQSMSASGNTAVSHSTTKDAGAAARRQTRMSGHKPMRTTHMMHTSHMKTSRMAHKTMSRSARKTKLSNTMGHKSAHQNQLEGATTSTAQHMSDQSRSTHPSN
jgi:hypothetical protein